MTKRILIAFLILMSTFFINGQAQDNMTLELDKSIYEGVGDRIKITLNAPALNKDIRVAEQTFATVNAADKGFGITLMLNETGKDTGVFSGSVSFSMIGSNNKESVLRVTASTSINVQCQGLSAEAQWIPYDASLSYDAERYSGWGVLPVITLEDHDLNTEPNNSEEASVLVKSGSDAAGVSIILKEIGRNSGVFTGCVKLSGDSSNSKDGRLKVKYNDEISVIYKDLNNTMGVEKVLTDSAIWTPQTATLRLNSSSYSGLNSVCGITVTDMDKNLDHDIRETIYVKVTSDKDPAGISPKLHETGADTGVFSSDINFSRYNSKSDWNTLAVSPKSSFKVSYCDDLNAENKKYTDIEAIAQFQFVEGVISTSMDSQARSMVITVKDADADSNAEKNTLPVKITSGSGTEELELILEETGANSGEFKNTLYLSTQGVVDRKKKDVTLVIAQGDEIRVTYNDATVPEGKAPVISKSEIWEYQKAELRADKASVLGYDQSVGISVADAEANKDPRVVDKVKLKITSRYSSNYIIILSETSADSGQFKGTLKFGKKEDKLKNIIKALTEEKVTLLYEDQGEYSAGTIEAYIDWMPSPKTK